MSSRLRANQRQLQAGIYTAWEAGAQCAVGKLATGGGKTVVMGAMAIDLADRGARGVVQAHRAELVGQISSALAAEGVRHNIIAAKKTIKGIVAAQMEDFGKTFYDPRARWDVASVDTLIRGSHPYASQVDYVFTDEGHHVLARNKWGRGIEQFPNARSLLMTATPGRADGCGMGRHADGIADALVIGQGLAQQMAEGFLTGYKVIAAQASDLDLSDVSIAENGEFNQHQVAKAIKRSKKIVGDVVQTYLEHVPGKRAIVFAVDIEEARKITDAFNARGVTAALLTGEDDETDVRRPTMKRFKAGEIQVLVNVDLFGEGVDVPAVEVVIMARPTASFALFSQQIGRMLRLFISPVLMAAWDTFSVAQRLQYIAESGKPFGVLIDHVGNIYREFDICGIKYKGLPEGFEGWTLDGRLKRRRAGDDSIPQRMCGNVKCCKQYERIYDACPYCGTPAPPPVQRGGPQFVDGKLGELSPELLARLRGDLARVDGECYVARENLGTIIGDSIKIRHAERQNQQAHLRNTIAQWAGYYANDVDSANQSRFFYKFGLDLLTALTLGAGEAEKLRTKVQTEIDQLARL